MVKIIVSDLNKNNQVIEARSGLSLMEALRENSIDGVVAECGGSLSCATCHVFIDTNWLAATGDISDMENEVLDWTASERQAGSRMSCQIKLTDKLDGLHITIPESQI